MIFMRRNESWRISRQKRDTHKRGDSVRFLHFPGQSNCLLRLTWRIRWQYDSGQGMHRRWNSLSQILPSPEKYQLISDDEAVQ